MDELGLTPRQLDCARVIHELTALNGYAPSYDEIMAEMDLGSRSRVHFLVHGLRDRGWLTLRPGARRSIRLLRVPAMPPERPVALTPAGREAVAGAAE